MKPLLIILSLICLTGCKKTIEKKAENAIMKAMTDGQWVITSFISDGSNITDDFSTYRFQYFSNYTVNAINNGTVENTGNWDGDVQYNEHYCQLSQCHKSFTAIKRNLACYRQQLDLRRSNDDRWKYDKIIKAR